MREDMREALKTAADRRGWSVSEEVDFRLGQSLDDDRRFGDLESQMFSRMIGATITFQQRALGKQPWWEKPESRDQIREALLDQIEVQLGKSPRWWPLPQHVAKRLNEFIASDKRVGEHRAHGLLRVVKAGLEKLGFPVDDGPANPEQPEGPWTST